MMGHHKPFMQSAGLFLRVLAMLMLFSLLSACGQAPTVPAAQNPEAAPQSNAANTDAPQAKGAPAPANDSDQAAQAVNLEVANAAPTLVITPSTLPDGKQGQSYSQQLTASGGASPYTFKVTEGALPSGMTLAEDGLLSGKPGESGTFSFTVQAVDAASATGTQAYTLVVATDGTAPVITSTVTGTLGENGWYVSAVTVTWTVVDGESPVTSKDGCDPTTLDKETPVEGTTLTCTATSTGGTASVSVTVKIDLTAPTVAITPDREPDKNGWYNHAVTFTTTGEDALSGIGQCDPPQTYSGPDGKDLMATGACKDLAGNSATATLTFHYDGTAPVVAPVVSPNPVYLHGSATVDAGATDVTSGIDPATVSCEALDTDSVGVKTVTCTASDMAGNTGSGSTTYSVIYKFDGFKPPLNDGWNRENGGRTIPVKWSLFDANDVPVDGVTVLFSVSEASCDSGAVTGGTEGPRYITGDLQPQKHGSYHYNWNTIKEYEGTCRVASVDLGEGITHIIQVQFK